MKEPEEIDQQARAALDAAGGRLMSKLDAMRAEEIGGDGALDPEARLALRKRGDAFLEELDADRCALRAGARRPRSLSWAAVAAVVVMMFAFAKLSTPPVVNKPAPVVVAIPSDPAQPGVPLDSPAIPEPGTGVLALVGGLMLALRRRR